MHLKTGDMVAVIAGKELGKRGKVLCIFPSSQRIAVEGINMVKRHTRATQQSQQGGILEKEGAMHHSNLMLLCSKCDRGVRVGSKILDDGSKVRVCKLCGEQI